MDTFANNFVQSNPKKASLELRRFKTLLPCYNIFGLYPCSIKTREVLGNPSLMPKRVEGNLGAEADFPITPEFWWSMTILFIMRDSTG